MKRIYRNIRHIFTGNTRLTDGGHLSLFLLVVIIVSPVIIFFVLEPTSKVLAKKCTLKGLLR